MACSKVNFACSGGGGGSSSSSSRSSSCDVCAVRQDGCVKRLAVACMAGVTFQAGTGSSLFSPGPCLGPTQPGFHLATEVTPWNQSLTFAHCFG